MGVIIDLHDIMKIMSYDGKIDGFVGTFKISKLSNTINQRLKSLISKANAIFMHVEMNENLSFASIEEITSKLFELELDFIFMTSTDNNLDMDTVRFSILATGINE